MLRVNREKVQKVFADYVEHYNSKDEKVKLKIVHTYRVADLSEQIAQSIGLNSAEKDLAWLIGMLHDIGRFEQLKNYGTFIDAQSIDHAAYGTDILFEQGVIRDYVDSTEEDELIETAIRCHNVYRIPEELDARAEMFCQILRDADKIDILKVNVDFRLEDIYNVTSEELRNAQVSEAVLESLKEHQATLRSLKQTSVDHVVGHISLVFELVYQKSLEIVLEQGYLDKLLNFRSDNPKTMDQFKKIRSEMERYIAKNRYETNEIIKRKRREAYE